MTINDYFTNHWHLLFCHGVINQSCTCNKGKFCSSPGKHPRARNGVKDSISDRFLFMEVWKQNPTANIALRTGPESGIWALDIDDDNIDFFNVVPNTLTIKTGRGRHYYFRYPDNIKITNRAKVLGYKVDVRGINGYVIIPPSRHVNGETYRVINDVPVIDAPSYLLEIVTS